MIVSAFNPRQAAKLAPGEHLALSAHPGLRLVRSATKSTWTYRYKSPDAGLMKQMKLGEWPAMPVSLAIEAWEKARGQRDKGTDVGPAKRAATKAVKVAAKATKQHQVQTVARVVEDYLNEIVEPNRKGKGAAESRRMLERAIAGVAALPAADLTAQQAHEIVLAVAATAPRVAAMTRQELRAAWAHAVSVGRIPPAVPFVGRTVGGKLVSKTRDRVLDATEVGRLLRWMNEPGSYSRTVRDALELTLRTGLRSGEVCGVHTRELELRADVLWLTVPSERMKAGKAHSCPLAGRAAEIVRNRMPAGGGYLFPARGGEKAIDQKVLGVEVFACSGRSLAPAYANRRVCPVKDWAPHDLRRTARTLLAELGCPFEIGEAILAHALPGVAAVYNRATYETAKLEWLTRLGEHLDVLQAAENIIALPRRAA